ncbi:similar to Saccharomyces cerevisiae YBL006C LDB7 Component of the RSC chromatin remodeling complex [Maudiozyma barnettii]|uniref:Similar to Saccharomyces cerevisiae YBL006C LDB7 Component of the RSC chromatin remodeling complex n=1 Tax=Maudiozyma barnettii TaxID=61262 RepID=A0A8H2ZI24_9SACH|nr:Ldb7p [Kazachstania barnettii]CAB4255092.1 similar to Saccharomyces cerevisiae YBL006C LDB7 Component of the RSC chromatin remodeling complex [Kazachstania barnettii]CAD1783363.1 similar to Saccharomyces cerevisiae YBL006C LDB7 Component of the RSC chromatin remodeling complex [Kazachstania barnettii]
MSTITKRDYYEVIGALSSFETSQEVVLSHEELKQLTEQKDSTEQKKTLGDKERIPVHTYLGSKVDMKEAAHASYDLSHTILGGYVPQRQLESLSSVDFAHYFNRTLDCDEALQIYDIFLPASARQCMLLSTQNEIDVRVKAKAKAKLERKQKAAAAAADSANGTDERVLPDGKIVRKVIVCKRCNRKFRGEDRMKQLKKHECTK